jgi:hypothetical protein
MSRVTTEQPDSYETQFLTRPLYTREEVLIQPCPIPRSSGVYGWWFRELPRAVDVSPCEQREGATLLYVGISPKRPPAIGNPSSEELRRRITYHYGARSGNAEGSTLRKTLGVLLGLELRRVGSGSRRTFGRTGEAVLTQWMSNHALVSWVIHPEPWLLEEELISTLDLPLNLQHNKRNANYAQLKRLRAAAERTARELPVLDEP